MHRYNEQSWLKFFSAASARNQFEVKAPPSDRAPTIKKSKARRKKKPTASPVAAPLIPLLIPPPVKSAAGQTMWWNALGIDVGFPVFHPKRGGGTVVAINADGDGRVHVDFYTGQEGTHRYNEQSWEKMMGTGSFKSKYSAVSNDVRVRELSHFYFYFYYRL